MTRKQPKTRIRNRRIKADMKLVTRRKLPCYARDMMMYLHRHSDRVYMFEWAELFDSFNGPKSASRVIFRRLRRGWRNRKTIPD